MLNANNVFYIFFQIKNIILCDVFFSKVIDNFGHKSIILPKLVPNVLLLFSSLKKFSSKYFISIVIVSIYNFLKCLVLITIYAIGVDRSICVRHVKNYCG